MLWSFHFIMQGNEDGLFIRHSKTDLCRSER